LQVASICIRWKSTSPMVACYAVQHLPKCSALCQLSQVWVRLSVQEHTTATFGKFADDSTSPNNMMLM